MLKTFDFTPFNYNASPFLDCRQDANALELRLSLCVSKPGSMEIKWNVNPKTAAIFFRWNIFANVYEFLGICQGLNVLINQCTLLMGRFISADKWPTPVLSTKFGNITMSIGKRWERVLHRFPLLQSYCRLEEFFQSIFTYMYCNLLHICAFLSEIDMQIATFTNIYIYCPVKLILDLSFCMSIYIFS